jgi:hypothetical protein
VRRAALSSLETVCFPFTGSNSAESTVATVPACEIMEVTEEGRDGGAGSEWIKSAAYMSMRGS